jgi:hypothetical protein
VRLLALGFVPSRHLLREYPPTGAEPAREVITSNTDSAESEALSTKTKINRNLLEAQQGRPNKPQNRV